MIHQPGLGKISIDNWETLPLELVLLSDLSTAAPLVTDEFLSALTPWANELVNTDYERLALTPATPTWNAGIDGWDFPVASVTTAALTAESITQGITGAVVVVNVDDDDALSWLVRSTLFPQVDLTGDTKTFTFTDGVVLRKRQAD